MRARVESGPGRGLLGVGGDVRLVVDPGQSRDCPGSFVASDVGRVCRVVWWADAQEGGVQDAEEVVVERVAIEAL